MKTELQSIYKYFSHHMRNSTAMIATSVTLLSYKMSNDEQQLFNEVIDSTSLLDLFDRGMHICFQDVFGESTEYSDSLSLEQAVMSFIEHAASYMKEKGIAPDLHINAAAIITGKVHEIHVLTDIIIYEMLISPEKMLTIRLKKNKIQIDIGKAKKAPEIWGIFKTILLKYGVKFTDSDK